MSWVVSAVGRTPAVLLEIAKQFANGSKCTEPEEGVRQAAAQLLGAAIGAQDPSVIIRVGASGSQSIDYKTNAVRNSLNISVEPLYGFVE